MQVLMGIFAPVLIQKSERSKFSKWNSKPLLFLFSRKLQPSSSINLRNGWYNLWGSLQRNSFSLLSFLNKLADIRVLSLLPLQHLAASEDKGIYRRKRKNSRLMHGWINLRNGFAVLLLQTIFFSSWHGILFLFRFLIQFGKGCFAFFQAPGSLSSLLPEHFWPWVFFPTSTCFLHFNSGFKLQTVGNPKMNKTLLFLNSHKDTQILSKLKMLKIPETPTTNNLCWVLVSE